MFEKDTKDILIQTLLGTLFKHFRKCLFTLSKGSLLFCVLYVLANRRKKNNPGLAFRDSEAGSQRSAAFRRGAGFLKSTGRAAVSSGDRQGVSPPFRVRFRNPPAMG